MNYLQSEYFLQNKYHTWYFNIITKAQSRGIKSKLDARKRFCLDVERHHITPKCLGGTNDKINLVFLTLKEHFVGHWLLTKMTEGKEKAKMLYALNGMKRVSENHPGRYSNKTTARVYEYIKPLIAKQHSELMKGCVPPNKGRKATGQALDNIREGTKNRRKLTPEERKAANLKSAATRTGMKRSEETKLKMSLAAKGKLKGPMSNEEKVKRSVALKGVPKAESSVLKRTETLKQLAESGNHHSQILIVCPHCGGEYKKMNYARWHGDNCRRLKEIGPSRPDIIHTELGSRPYFLFTSSSGRRYKP